MFNNGKSAVEKYAVKVDNVSFGYGKNTMLENLNLHVDKCSIYGLIGNSGAGKLKLIQFHTK
jgi:ABC-type transporter Mla maintaining outer membrane lipid asymmetry ATPase subunit MlaF